MMHITDSTLNDAHDMVAVLLPLLLTVGIFVYPATFTPELQTPLGWFENDVYLGLLMVAAYLTLQRFRRASLTR